MLAGKYRELYSRLQTVIPVDRLIHDDLRVLAFGTDASFYRLIPHLVVKVHNEAEAIHVIKSCRTLNLPLTVRGSGTSLSGQAITESVLMLVVGSEWQTYSINEKGSEITVQPGVLGYKINQYLMPYGRRLGPDPASINHAQIGGIVSNNAAGMSSGVRWNSYHTVSGMRIVFNDGTVLDTRDDESRKLFLTQKKELVKKLTDLAKSTKRKRTVAKRIKDKFSIKNTTGYSVNALVDFTDPIDIIMHLMVGAEGTLGFVSEISFKTIDDPPKKATALILFPDIKTACETIPILKTCKVATAEMMDRASLRSVEDKDEMPDYLKTLDEGVAALLVETRAKTDRTLQKQVAEIKKKLSKVPLVRPLEFTTDARKIAGLWNVRKGLFTSVASSREKGTTVIIEDIAVPYEHLAEALLELQKRFKKYHYNDAIIWGHAFDGNVHFVLTQNFSREGELQRYQAFIDELVTLVLDRYDGSLKAEHGTGRNMAPFVEKEWGSEIYQIMHQVKHIFDAENIFNPGVLLNDDREVHLKNLKPMPMAHELIDACIECGFCENSCVSRDLTLSPRQRIVIYREISHLTRTGAEPHRLAQLQDDFNYYGDQTCATDGLCALSCPVGIDTGLLIKEIRAEKLTPRSKKIAAWIADNMDRVTAFMRFSLDIVHYTHLLLGSSLMKNIADGIRSLSGNRIPKWMPAMPRGGRPALPAAVDEANPLKVVYFSSCINRSMGISKDYDQQVPLTVKTEQLLRKAGYEIIYPENINRLCCGMPWASKGFKEIGDRKAHELEAALIKASENGVYPVLVDMSPCLYRMKEVFDPSLKLYDPIEFALEFLTERLEFEPSDEPITIFSVCSAKKMGLEESFLKLARMCSTKVIVNESACCGFAGDRGFTHPELNDAGLKYLKEQIPAEVKHGYSTSRTCEIGLTEHSDISYQSIFYLVDRVTTPKAK